MEFRVTYNAYIYRSSFQWYRRLKNGQELAGSCVVLGFVIRENIPKQLSTRSHGMVAKWHDLWLRKQWVMGTSSSSHLAPRFMDYLCEITFEISYVLHV